VTRWREPLADLQARVASITFLAERSEHPGRWAALDRAGRLHRACLAQPDRRARPPLVALIGGTNTGKSTLYNLLLGERIALPCGTAIGTKAIALSGARDDGRAVRGCVVPARFRASRLADARGIE